MARDYTYTPYNAAVTTAFTQNINHLPAIREEIYTTFSTGIARFEEAFVGSVDIRSASAFSVQLNRNTIMAGSLFPTMEWDYGSVVDPVTIGGEYVVRYNGPIDRIVFLGDSSVTLTYLQVGWGAGKLEHKVVEFTAPESTTIVLKDSVGAIMQPCDTLKYELYIDQLCTYTATNADYATLTDIPFVYNWEDAIVVPMTEKTYTITFAVTPSAATIVVKDAEDAVVAPTSNRLVYVLADSSVAGSYTYTVSAPGYEDGTGTIDAQADATETVSLSVLTWEVVYSVTPTSATFVLSDAADDPITPDSTTPAGTYTYNALQDSRVAGNYSYAISKAGYASGSDTLTLQDDVSDTVEITALTWDAVFTVTPTDATFVLSDSEANPITPDSITPAGTYTFNALEDSRAAGVYSYTSNATGYEEATDTVDLQADANVPVTMDALTWEIIFTVDPTDSTFELWDASHVLVTPDSVLPEGT
jgi:hypothetical protein